MTFHQFVIAAAAVALWLGSLYVHPFGKCWRCRGRGVIFRGGTKSRSGSKRKPKPPRPVTCPKCKGIRRQQRLGSRTLHTLGRRVQRELDRQRKARLAERTVSHADRNL